MSPQTRARYRAKIGPTDRITMTNKLLENLSFPVEQNINHYKPNGLWYATGTEWIDWCHAEMPCWLADNYYKIETTDRVLKIDTPEKLEEFTKAFHVYPTDVPGPRYWRNVVINWPKVAEHFAGIEISPYQQRFRLEYMWYYGWDVASGCIWDKAGITNLKRLSLRSKKPAVKPEISP